MLKSLLTGLHCITATVSFLCHNGRDYAAPTGVCLIKLVCIMYIQSQRKKTQVYLFSLSFYNQILRLCLAPCLFKSVERRVACESTLDVDVAVKLDSWSDPTPQNGRTACKAPICLVFITRMTMNPPKQTINQRNSHYAPSGVLKAPSD